MKICYIDAFSGIAGDMLLAALIDAGADLSLIIGHLKTLKSIKNEWKIDLNKVLKSEGRISAAYVSVTSAFDHMPATVPGSSNALDESLLDRHNCCDDSNSQTQDCNDVVQDDGNIEHNHSHMNRGSRDISVDSMNHHAHNHDHSEDYYACNIHEDHCHDYDVNRQDHSHENYDFIDNSNNSNDTNSLSHNHSHSRDLSHNHSHSRDLSHNHSHSSHNTNDHNHSHSGDLNHSHNHERGLSFISNMILESDLPDKVKRLSIKSFTELAIAEAKVHGTTIDQVHFHEVGAIDSIIDTVGVIVAMYLLDIEQVYCSTIPLSSGTVWTAHGLLPVPAPATLYLLQDMILTAGPKGATGELVTPTGASLIRSLCGLPSLNTDSINATHFQGCLPPNGFKLGRIGIGAGTKDFAKHPNILRVLIGVVQNPIASPVVMSSQSYISQVTKLDIPNYEGISVKQDLQSINLRDDINSDYNESKLIVLESNIDDITSEMIGYLIDYFIGFGVNDCWVESIQMKKNRPAFKLCILTTLELKEKIIEKIFEETTTIGVRIQLVDRISLKRSIHSIVTDYGEITAKASTYREKIIQIKPEFDDCKALAQSLAVPLKNVLSHANEKAQQFKSIFNSKNPL